MGTTIFSNKLLRTLSGAISLLLLASTSVLSTGCSMQFFRNKNKAYTITNGNPKVTVVVGMTYTILPVGGFGPYSYKLISGPGSVDPVTGVYTAPATFTPTSGSDPTAHVTILVTDSHTKEATFTLYVVNPVALNINSLDIQPTPVDPPYNAFSATMGKPPYTFSMQSGNGSIDLNTGVFTPPNAEGVSNIIVTDSDGNTDTAIIYVYYNLDTTGVLINVPINGTYTVDMTNVLVTGKPPFNFLITAGGGSMSAANGATSNFLAPAVSGLTTLQITDALAAVKTVTFNSYNPLTYVPTTRNVQISTTYPFGVTGGVPPYSHLVQSGAISGGINAGTGLFTATATSGPAVVQVTDSIGNTATASVNVYDPLQITPTSYSLVIGQHQTFSGVFGVPPYSYSVAAGVGAINPVTGDYVSGVNGAATVRVTDFMGNIANAAVTVSNALTVPPLVVMQLGNTYTISPVGGQAPFTFAPTGCAGIITVAGGPAATSAVSTLGLGSCTVTVTDSSLPTAQTQTMTFTVNPVLGISCVPATIATTNTSTCTASNGVPGYTYSVVGGAPNGTITVGGVYTPPAGAGVYTARVTDSYTPGNIQNFAITVNAALSVAPASPTIQVAQNVTITASGGVPPYVFSKQSGPADATVTTLTGTTAKGTAGMTPGTLNLLATDSLGNTAVASIGIATPAAINGAPAARNIHKNQTNVITPAGGAPAANGGLTTYTYTITAGGGSLSAGSGATTTYTAPGATGSATVAIDDGVSATYNVVFTIIPDLTISPTTKDMMVGTTTTFTSGNVVGAPTYSVVSGGGGSIVAGTGAYTAPGAVPGANPATIRTTDNGVQTADALVTLYPALTVTASSGSGNMLVSTSQTLNISGGVQPYTFSLAGGGGIAPSGLQGMGVTSTLYTAPATAQTDTFTVTDSQVPPNVVNFTLTILNLTAPTGFTVTGYTATSINTSWSAVAGATTYDYNVDGGAWTSNGGGLTRNYTGLTTAPHTLGIRPVNGALIGTPSYLTQAICPAGQSAGLNVAACTNCAAGNYSTVAASTSCTPCTAGTYQPLTGQTSCNNCPAGNWVGAGSSTCANACTGPQTISKYWIAGVNASATTCTEGNCANAPTNATYIAPYTGTSSTCNYACNSGYGSAACTACGGGTYDSTPGTLQDNCSNCGPGFSTGGSGTASACNACAAGSYSNGVANLNCTSCIAGYGNGYYQGSSGQNSCNACGPGNSTGGGQTACTACGTGTFSGGAANLNCTACTNGIANGSVTGYAASSGLTTNSCPIGSVSCNAGYGNAGSSCNACGVDTYSAGGGATCTGCAAGQYAGVTASSCTNCTNAPANSTSVTYSTTGGGGNSCNFTSVTCAGGYSWNGNTTAGGAACNLSACASGWGWNGSACAQCTASTYDPTPGALQDACVSCPVGQYSAAGATGCSACTGLPANASWTTNGTANNCSWACNGGYTNVGGWCETTLSVSWWGNYVYCGAPPANGEYGNKFTATSGPAGTTFSSNCNDAVSGSNPGPLPVTIGTQYIIDNEKNSSCTITVSTPGGQTSTGSINASGHAAAVYCMDDQQQFNEMMRGYAGYKTPRYFKFLKPLSQLEKNSAHL